MRKSLLLAAAVLAACVTPEAAPDPRGAVKSGQRLIVMVHQSPGPWIVADPDSKAETALKLLPLGTFLQGMQEDRINELSKELQPYLPRPRYGEAVERSLIAALKPAHDGPVLTAAEAGIDPRARKDWNAATDQLDWRRKYFYTETGHPSPRDYSKILSLDDAVVLDVNVSFGLEPDAEERTLPLLSAAARLYRADTNRMIWSREERLSDTTSSTTLTEFRAAPAELTDRLFAMSEPLAVRLAGALAREVSLMAAPPPITAEAPQVSTAPVTELPPVTAAPPPPAPEPPSPFPSPVRETEKPQSGFPTH